MQRPDFSKLTFSRDWPGLKTAAGETHLWQTPEKIAVPTVPVAKNHRHLRYAAGIAPFLRGPYSSMYALQA